MLRRTRELVVSILVQPNYSSTLGPSKRAPTSPSLVVIRGVMVAGISLAALQPASPSMSSSLLQPGSALGRRRLSSLPQMLSFRERPPVSDSVALLVQEWLTIVRFPATLKCLLDEYSRECKRPPPAMDKWVELTQQLDLDAAPSNQSQLHASPNHTLLDRIVSQTLDRAQRRKQLVAKTHPPHASVTTVLVRKRPFTASAALKFASKRSLPGSSSSSFGHSTSASTLRSPGLRPQSATAIVVSKSTPTFTTLEEPIVASTNNQCSPPATTVINKQASRPISAAPGSLTPHRDSQSSARKTSRPGSPADSPSRRQSAVSAGRSRALHCSSSSLRHLVGRSSMSELTPLGDSKAAARGTTAEEHAPEKDEFELAIELEDMTEERLTEQFSGFSKSNIKKLRRVLAKSSAHSQDLQRTRKAMDKIQLKAQLQHARCSIAAKQTELLSTTMDMLIKEPCSLCRYVFLKKNLSTRVSYKSICDLRASWAAAATMTKPGAGQLTRDVATLSDDDDDPIGVGNSAATLESTQQISHLYDEVPVCVFCAQLALDFSSYRPSSAEQKQHREAQRRAAVDRQRDREAQRARDRLKCDPLDFHAFELNSDDDDDETDEVLEVDAEGRVQVVRRDRRRRPTMRIPAQTGLVSKRLHYDHLRSQSVHALNHKEWQVISRGET